MSNIQVVEIQITLQDGHRLVNYNEIHLKITSLCEFGQEPMAWTNEDLDNRGSDLQMNNSGN